MANLQTHVTPTTDRIGDVVGVQFPDEEDVALFIPCSGDVLLCTVGQWRSLKDMSVSGRPDSFIGQGSCDNSVDDPSPSSDLRFKLLSLGALLA